MNYLIIPKTGNAFYTNWWAFENNYNVGDVVVDLYAQKISHDGKIFENIEEDHL